MEMNPPLRAHAGEIYALPGSAGDVLRGEVVRCEGGEGEVPLRLELIVLRGDSREEAEGEDVDCAVQLGGGVDIVDAESGSHRGGVGVAVLVEVDGEEGGEEEELRWERGGWWWWW